MTLRKLTANMTAASNRSWITQLITFTDGWWRSWRMATRARSANILTPLSRNTNFGSHETLSLKRFLPAWRAALSFVLIVSVSLGFSAASFSQTSKKKKTKKHSVPCRAGCKPDTTAPEIATTTADDAEALQQLSETARALHNSTPGAYDKLAAFANKHANDIWG